MTKSQWIEKAAKQSALTKKELTDAYQALSKVLIESLCDGESVQISGLGTFSVRCKEEHTARNPKTGELLSVPPSRKVVFLPGKTLKEKINYET